MMTTPVKIVEPETTIKDAIFGFAEEGLHYLPVIDDNGQADRYCNRISWLVMLTDKATA